jgi:hypothetical protein
MPLGYKRTHWQQYKVASMVVTLQGVISRHVNMGLQVQNAHEMLDNVGTQDSTVLAKHHNVLIGR